MLPPPSLAGASARRSTASSIALVEQLDVLSSRRESPRLLEAEDELSVEKSEAFRRAVEEQLGMPVAVMPTG